MSKPLRSSWTCFRCLRRQEKVFQRRIATAATAPIPQQSPIAYQDKTKHDDNTLRQIFDSRVFWQDFLDSGRRSWNRESVGLFQNYHLRTPEGFYKFGDVTLKKCHKILQHVLAISTVEEYKKLVQYLDRLSDFLCRVIDIADFVRSTHPDPSFQSAATTAHQRMFEYMNMLNTTPGLNNQLKTALNNPEVTAAWTEEELRVAHILRKDFSQSAIDLPEDKRQRFVALSNDINELGSRFLDHIQPEKFELRVRGHQLQGLDPRILKDYAVKGGWVNLPTFGPVVSHALSCAQNESLRRDLYVVSRTAAEEQVTVLESIMKARAELAGLSGFKSYGSMALSDKMAGSPEAVSRFLDALAGDNKGHVEAELARLSELKANDRRSDRGPLNAWDREYYRRGMIEVSSKATRTSDFLPAFFSLGTVMQGLSRLFNSLYGVRFKPVEPLPGETWSPEVRRLDVVDENDERIAIVYCDLFARPGKSPNPAHFTLRCSRLITASEIEENATLQNPKGVPRTDPIALANDGMATTALRSGSAYQLPTIALICDFPQPPSLKSPPLLPTSQLTTLFHEMGHAIHSILGRTALQNVAGTRCATDFAELPSILMEHFATDPAVLGLYARHWESGAALPAAAAQQIQARAQAADGGGAEREGAADTEWQIILSLLDQAYHSPLAAEEGFDSSAVARGVYARYASVPEPERTRWQGFFGHLVGYGGSYYAYLFDRAIAKRVWEVVFKGGEGGAACQRERGERFRNEVLRWGGSREPWRCVVGVLGDERLEGGGERAMEVVGSWGVRS